MLQLIKEMLARNPDGIEVNVAFVGSNKGRPIRLLTADEIGISYVHLPSMTHLVMVPWRQVDNLNLPMSEAQPFLERPDGVAPSSHAGEPRSSDGRAAWELVNLFMAKGKISQLIVSASCKSPRSQPLPRSIPATMPI